MRNASRSDWSRAAVIGLAVALGGCGYAKRADMEAELATLRQEMRSGDEALGARVDQLDARTAAIERALNELREEFNVTVTRLEGMLAFNVPVHFEFDRSDVRPTDRPVLDRFAAVVNQYYPEALVTVEGFTDPAGSVAYNQRLGKERAESVKEYLTGAGVSSERVRTVSYGKSADRLVAPGASGPGEAGMENRRVSLVIDFNGPRPSVERPVTVREGTT